MNLRDLIAPHPATKSLIAHIDPKSPAAEAYRALRTSLQFAGVDRQIRTLVISSPGQEDGKTTTICNLAVSMAQAGKKVLVIDADMRKPRLHHFFKLMNTRGLSQIAAENEDPATVEKNIQSVVEIPNLHVLSAGAIPPNPAEILGSNRMKQLLDRLRSQFDMVLIDTPPSSHLTDAAVIGRISDGCLMVLSCGETNIEKAKLAKRNMDNAGVNLIGAVLAKMQSKKSGGYYYYYAYK